VPEEDAFATTARVTDQALFYKQEETRSPTSPPGHRGGRGHGGAPAYSIRGHCSPGQEKLTVAATGKDPLTGKMRTEEYTVKGPLAVMLTTTRTDFDQEP